MWEDLQAKSPLGYECQSYPVHEHVTDTNTNTQRSCSVVTSRAIKSARKSGSPSECSAQSASRKSELPSECYVPPAKLVYYALHKDSVFYSVPWCQISKVYLTHQRFNQLSTRHSCHSSAIRVSTVPRRPSPSSPSPSLGATWSCVCVCVTDIYILVIQKYKHNIYH